VCVCVFDLLTYICTKKVWNLPINPRKKVKV